MSRALCLLLCLSSLAFAQNSSHQAMTAPPPTSAVQVVYIVAGSTLTTYNVDPQTLQASEAGTITLAESVYPTLVASANGQFLYYLAYQNVSDQGHMLYVYDTNASGVPGQNPVQQMKASQLLQMAAHPGGKFLYSIAVGPVGPQFTQPYSIVRNLINPNNGKLSEPVTEATYQLDSDVSANDCYLWVLGFNAAGTTMYDGIFCSGPHGSGSTTYNQRSVNLQTGALGADQEVYSYSYYAGSENVGVRFAGNLMFAFIGYFNQGPNANLVDVYQMPNVSTPVINCTASLWAVCGDSGLGLVHPSGKYVFLTDPTNATDIGAVNLSTQQITQTSSIPYPTGQLSPDGTIAYAVNYVNETYDIDIFGFNVATGDVIQGGTITDPSDLDLWIAAERY
jgi:hypothetical protein